MPQHQIKVKRKATTIHDKFTDVIASFAGSMSFVYVHAVIFAFWLVYNILSDGRGFDPYPFGLLTLAVSLEAIFLAIFILIAQNHQVEQTDKQAQKDYAVDVRTEKEMRELKQLILDLREQVKKLGQRK